MTGTFGALGILRWSSKTTSPLLEGVIDQPERLGSPFPVRGLWGSLRRRDAQGRFEPIAAGGRRAAQGRSGGGRRGARRGRGGAFGGSLPRALGALASDGLVQLGTPLTRFFCSPLLPGWREGLRYADDSRFLLSMQQRFHREPHRVEGQLRRGREEGAWACGQPHVGQASRGQPDVEGDVEGGVGRAGPAAAGGGLRGGRVQRGTALPAGDPSTTEPGRARGPAGLPQPVLAGAAKRPSGVHRPRAWRGAGQRRGCARRGPDTAALPKREPLRDQACRRGDAAPARPGASRAAQRAGVWVRRPAAEAGAGAAGAAAGAAGAPRGAGGRSGVPPNRASSCSASDPPGPAGAAPRAVPEPGVAPPAAGTGEFWRGFLRPFAVS